MTKNLKPRILYVYPRSSTFIRRDLEALSKDFRIHHQQFDRGGKWMLPFSLVLQLLWLVRHRMAGARDVVGHFAGYHTVLPVLLGFRTHIIIAGNDSCSFPGIGHGSFRKPLLGKAIGFSLRRAATILPVHASLARFTNDYSDLGPREQGFLHFVDGIRAAVIPIPYGFDAQTWSCGVEGGSRQGVLCVAAGAGFGGRAFLVKGLDILSAAAAGMPDVPFTLVGVDTPGDYPVRANVKVIGRVTPQQLRELMASSSIYCQASVAEGFPNGLCEAMLMGCLPVVSNVTSMPEIVGANGRVIARRDPALLRQAIAGLLALPAEEQEPMRQRARESIASRFPAALRTDRLVAVIKASMGMGKAEAHKTHPPAA
ncbi:MAG: glycosyltransferase family 4 protein [Flavobacteriales bacterium]|nr:glycosyltransferase family 4 protein [Flavobacteriales bacterium]MEB2340849.1 glycosyltransferase family 4 protein [Flavobacteriia bacterium]